MKRSSSCKPPLPYYLGAGRSEFRLGEHHPNRRNLGIYDLLIVAKGELHIGENGQQWALSDGDTLLLLPNGEHYSVKACEQETSFYWVHFEHANRPEGVPLTMTRGRTIRLGRSAILMRCASATCPAIQSRSRIRPDTACCCAPGRRLLLGRAASVGRPVGHAEGGRDGCGASPSSRLAERAAAYLQQNYRTDITNESLAAALHFHPNHIVRCMKSKYGRTPIHYLHDFRLETSQTARLSLRIGRSTASPEKSGSVTPLISPPASSAASACLRSGFVSSIGIEEWPRQRTADLPCSKAQSV